MKAKKQKTGLWKMSEYYNLIQIIAGIASVILIFIGIFLSVRKLNPEKYETIPVKSTVISTAVIAAGLLCYAIVKTCTNLTVVTEEKYEVTTVYIASLIEVIKLFGFILFVPLLFRLFKPKAKKPEKSEEEIADE